MSSGSVVRVTGRRGELPRVLGLEDEISADLISPIAVELCGTYFRHSDTGGIVCGVPGEVITSDWTLHWVIRPRTFWRSASVDVRFRETWRSVYGLEVGTPGI
jgi:hypothetical protein